MSGTCLSVFDGKNSLFDSMPAYVKGRHPDHKSMFSKMGVDRNSTQKLFAIVLEAYKPKGPNNFDIADRKIRVGYGTAKVSLAPRDTSARNVANMFKIATPSSKQTTDVKQTESQQEVPADQPNAEHQDVNDAAVTSTRTDLQPSTSVLWLMYQYCIF